MNKLKITIAIISKKTYAYCVPVAVGNGPFELAVV